MTKGHNNPPICLELTQEEAEFVLRNCDTNIQQMLAMLQQDISLGSQEKLGAMIEQFSAIRDKTREAIG